MFFDYYEIIKQPMTMNQIKKRIGKDTSLTLQQFHEDMILVWENARTYNQEGSWVYNAAEDMQESFDKLWEEDMAKMESTGGDGDSGPAWPMLAGQGSGQASGTSTPMYKPEEKAAAPKIKISVGVGAGRRKVVEPDPTPDASEESDPDIEDDDY